MALDLGSNNNELELGGAPTSGSGAGNGAGAEEGGEPGKEDELDEDGEEAEDDEEEEEEGPIDCSGGVVGSASTAAAACRSLMDIRRFHWSIMVSRSLVALVDCSHLGRDFRHCYRIKDCCNVLRCCCFDLFD